MHTITLQQSDNNSLDSAVVNALKLVVDDGSCIPVEIRQNAMPQQTQWEIPSQLLKFDAPTILTQQSDQYLLIFPVEASRTNWKFLLGTVTASDPNMVTRLAQAAWKNAQLQQQTASQAELLDKYADQVLHDFTELDWIKQLIGHLELNPVDSDLNKTVRDLLVPLREFTNASLMAYVPASAVNKHCGADLNANDVSSFQFICLSDHQSERQQAARLLLDYRTEAQHHAVLKSRYVTWDEAHKYPGVESFLLVEVSKNNRLSGWLICVNRRQKTASIGNEDEYSTQEAGLLIAAGSILASHDLNLRLFRGNQELSIGAIRAMAAAVDAKDKYTRGHSDRVARLAFHLAQKLQLRKDDCARILLTGLVHDVGKIGVPDAVLSKPGKLTDEEFELIKQHPKIGYEIVKPMDGLSFALEGVLYHHESYDGNGYPSRLEGEKIPLAARIIAVADAYDAMTSTRPYRHCMSWEKAESIIREGAGKQWDPQIVAIFAQEVEQLRRICTEDSASINEIYDVDAAALAIELSDVSKEHANASEITSEASTTTSVPPQLPEKKLLQFEIPAQL